jgi:hypothetical protein
LQAQKAEIHGLQSMRHGLQQQLQTASPAAKPAIINQIQALAVAIAEREAELPALEAALRACETRFQDVFHDFDLVVVER